MAVTGGRSSHNSLFNIVGGLTHFAAVANENRTVVCLCCWKKRGTNCNEYLSVFSVSVMDDWSVP